MNDKLLSPLVAMPYFFHNTFYSKRSYDQDGALQSIRSIPD